MQPEVFLAIVACAAVHAAWNSFLKIKTDPAVATTMLAIGGGVVATVALFFTGMPQPAAMPFIAASATIHIFYWSYLGKSYSMGDLGQVYPIARGCAPLLTALGAIIFAREYPPLTAWIGILTVVMGVLIIALRGGRGIAWLDRKVVAFSIVTAFTITGYSLVDGIGARHTDSAFGYIAFLYVCNGWTLLIYGLVKQRQALVEAIDANWHLGLLTGAMSLLGYGVGIWAMTKAPIAQVAALRETSIVFALIFAMLLLKEPFRPARTAGACVVCAGLFFIRLA